MKEILLALAERPMTEPVLAHVTGVDKEDLAEMLGALIANDLIEEDSNKYVITDAGRRSLNLAAATHELPIAGSLMELGDDVPGTDDIGQLIVETELEVPTDIATALASLSAALTKRQIQNLPTKLAVLERLSALLDPTIATVLNEIQHDLQVAA